MRKFKNCFYLICCLLLTTVLATKSAFALNSSSMHFIEEQNSQILLDAWGKPLLYGRYYKIATAEHPRSGLGYNTWAFQEYGKIEENHNNVFLDQPMTGQVLEIGRISGNFSSLSSFIARGDKIKIEFRTKRVDSYLGSKIYNGNSWTTLSGLSGNASYQKFEVNALQRENQPLENRLVTIKNIETNGYLWVGGGGWVHSDGNSPMGLNAHWVFVPVNILGQPTDRNGYDIKN